LASAPKLTTSVDNPRRLPAMSEIGVLTLTMPLTPVGAAA